MKRNARISTVLFVSALIMTIIGSTFAYFSWSTSAVQNTLVTFTVNLEFSCSADGGGEINNNNGTLAPAGCTNSNYAIQRTIKVNTTQGQNMPIYLSMNLKVLSMDDGLAASPNFKYALTTQANNCTSNVINQGTFEGAQAGSLYQLIYDKEYLTTTSNDTYYLYIWLDPSETSATTQNQNFRIVLDGSCSNIEQEEHSVSIVAGNGIDTMNYGGSSNLTTINKTLKTGETLYLKQIGLTYDDNSYTGAAYTVMSGSGSVNGNYFTAGNSNATVQINPSYPRFCYCNGGTMNAGTVCNIGVFTYKYKYKMVSSSWQTLTDDGWGAKITDATSTAPVTETMCGYINDKPLAATSYAFASSQATSIDCTGYYTKYVTQMTYMFKSIAATQLTGTENFDLTSATNIGGMFSAMTNITTVNLTNWHTSNITNYNALFQNSSNLTTIYASDDFVIASGATGSNAFKGCSSLIGGAGTPFNGQIIKLEYARIDRPEIEQPGYFTLGPP